MSTSRCTGPIQRGWRVRLPRIKAPLTRPDRPRANSIRISWQCPPAWTARNDEPGRSRVCSASCSVQPSQPLASPVPQGCCTAASQHRERRDRRQLDRIRNALPVSYQAGNRVGNHRTGGPTNGTISSTRRVPPWRRPATLDAAWLYGRSAPRRGYGRRFFALDAGFRQLIRALPKRHQTSRGVRR
jgi:hypothetical protein